MLCKIADPKQQTEPLVWRRIGADPDEDLDQSKPPLGISPGSSLAVQPPRRQSLSQLAQLQRRIAELEAQAPIDLQKARQAGLEQGQRQAREEAAAEMQAALDRLARTIHDLAQVKRKARNEAETELVKLSLSIARRILHREISTDPQSMRGIVHAALDRLQNREVSRIRVFPAAVQAVRSALERNGGTAAIEIIPDDTLQPGGILFETALGDLDASVQTQLQEIERGFADRLRG
jgi:flagellar assembly protein FliH